MTDAPIWQLHHQPTTPLLATAIHDGHQMRPELADRLALSEQERLQEEDPFTGAWTAVAQTRLIGLRSRFEVDLNRPRDKAIYRTPEDAWGLRVWREPLPPEMIARSLAQYDAFYQAIDRLFTEFEDRFGRFVVLDLHSYNHRRSGPQAPPADPALNPEVNLGTGSLDRDRWGGLIDRFIADLRAFDFLGRHLDVRENVKFTGGNFARWSHRRFPQAACVLAIEFKKFFMDEWSGEPDLVQLEAIRRALEATIPGLLEELGQV